jgi:NitT/TauT family transport system substrate-binding protein
MKKIIFLFLAGCCFTGLLFAKAEKEITVYAIKGPSGVGMIRMFENPPAAKGFTVKMEALAQADLMAAKFISGEAKMGILPANMAAKIASSGKKLQIAAVTGTGMLSLLSLDSSVRRIEDLAGKTVEVAGQGATPDYVLQKILLSKGLRPGSDITLGYSLAYPEIAQSLVAGRITLALLPEPFATMARSGNPNITVVSDIQSEWAAAVGSKSSSFPMTVFVVDSVFAAGNPGLVSLVLKALKNSEEWVTANPKEAGALVEKHEFGLKAAVAAAAIPRSNYVYIPAPEARADIEALYRAFLEFAPGSIGGALPGDDFYFVHER